MPDTIREFALEQLAAAGELAETRHRHAEHFLAVAETAEPHLTQGDRWRWFGRLATGHDDLRAALSSTLGPLGAPPPDLGARLAAALPWYWAHCGLYREGSAWLRRALATSVARPPGPLRAKLLFGAVMLGEQAGETGAELRSLLAELRSLLEESVALWRRVGDARLLAFTLPLVAARAAEDGNPARSPALHEESVATFRRLGDRWGLAWALHQLGQTAAHHQDWTAARLAFEESRAIFRDLGDAAGVATTSTDLGRLALRQGDPAQAAAALEESLGLWRRLGRTPDVTASLLALRQLTQAGTASTPAATATRAAG